MASEPITIGRFAHRRLHHLKAGAYIALDDPAMTQAGGGEDNTRLIFNQIIVQRGGHG
jgi:polyhydroxyalkanoate synthesis regulator protein